MLDRDLYQICLAFCSCNAGTADDNYPQEIILDASLQSHLLACLLCVHLARQVAKLGLGDGVFHSICLLLRHLHADGHFPVLFALPTTNQLFVSRARRFELKTEIN